MAKLLLTPLVLLVGLATAGAVEMFDAAAWVKSHKSANGDDPDMDNLNELQGSNPMAYALVKALLLKNSLGLIKRKESVDTSSSDSGGDSSSSSSDGTPQVDENGEPIAESEPRHAPKSFGFGWKPPDDAAAVQSVLGAVGGALSAVKTSKPTKTNLAPEAATPEELSSSPWLNSKKEAPAAVEKHNSFEAEESLTPEAAKPWRPSKSLASEEDATPAASSTTSDTEGESLDAAFEAENGRTTVGMQKPAKSSDAGDDIFSKGRSAVQAESNSGSQKTGGKSGAFWGDLFGGSTKEQQPEQKPAPVPKKKDISAIGESTGSGFLKTFNWNSDDSADQKRAAPSGALPDSNSYAHFLS